LKTRAVLNFGGNSPGHGTVDLARLRIRQLHARLVIAFNNEIDLANVHTIVFAEDVGHFPVDFDDYQLRALDRSPLPNIRRAKVEVPAIVDWASPENDDVYGIEKAPIIIRHFSQIEWHVVAAAGVMLFAVVARKMPTEHVEVLALRVFFDHSARTHCQTGADFDIVELVLTRG
jgi:hypothetical protein